MFRKETIGIQLGISLATVNNWIKTHVIPSPDFNDYYREESFKKIIDELKKNSTRLSSRANRTFNDGKYICYLGISGKTRKEMLNNVIRDFETSGFSVEEGVLALSFAILRSNNIIDSCWEPNNNSRLDAALSSWAKNIKNFSQIRSLYDKYIIGNLDDDFLGAFYQSIQSISQKSSKGSYYTPSVLLDGIKIEEDKTVLDPCCGSGGILLRTLSKGHDSSKICVSDIDETALKICFINLALFFNDKDIAAHVIKKDIASLDKMDMYSEFGDMRFDFVITNPPWGSKFTKQQKDYLLQSYPELATSEIFSIALYNALKLLNKTGELYFFLPRAFLNVAAHRNIRHYVFNGNNEISVNLLGNAFSGVLSESILLHIKKGISTQKIYINNKCRSADKDRGAGKGGSAWTLPMTAIKAPDYIVSASSNAHDITLLNKIYNTEHYLLNNDIVFALGIVTGSNDKYLHTHKTPQSEAICRGKDIQKYLLSKPEYYIVFTPDVFQQTAPEEYYRQKKIVYRFISDKIICALDTKNSLLLNSANLFVSNSYPMETIVSMFNSDIYTYIFRKKFHSYKVLKSHLQSLPLPVLSDGMHQYIAALYNRNFSGGNSNINQFQAVIDSIICKSFKISEKEYSYIRSECNGNS